MTESYDVYPGGQDDLPWELRDGPDDGERLADLTGVVPAPDEGGWCVVVEYANRHGTNPPTRLEVLDDDLPTRAEAEVVARHRAFEFEPPDPLAPQHREVYEDAPGFLTVIQGATKAFHFTTRVVRFAGLRK